MEVVVLYAISVTKIKAYIVYNFNNKRTWIHFPRQASRFNLTQEIQDYHEKFPKWLLLYQLKENWDGWLDVFEHHVLPYYMINIKSS